MRHGKFFRVFWTAFILTILSLAFAAAYFFTAEIYRQTGLHPAGFVIQLVNSFLGMILAATVIGLYSHYFQRQQMNVFQPIIQALERISKGDFSIRLEDVDDKKRLGGLVRSINQMAEELGQMETMRQDFVANVSHEIQSPLTSIRGFAQAAQDENISLQERQHYLNIIEMESKRLSRLADDILKLASLESDRLKLSFKRYRLDKQVRSLALVCEPQWREKKIELEVDLAELNITADEDLLSQVWLNLIHNSIKFTSAGGAVRLSLHAHERQAVFQISDNGIGISPQDQMHIFERFYKADKSRTAAKEGSGLGLSIVRKIIELHHGEIDVSSQPGVGTTFTIRLPLE